VDLWQRYGKVGLGAVGGGLALLAGVLGWQQYQRSAAATQNEQLTQAYEALGAGKTADAAKQLATISSSGKPIYRALAQ
ncbi:tetratricopeptide repeat protein, partial [Acinetobacter baumannii]